MPGPPILRIVAGIPFRCTTDALLSGACHSRRTEIGRAEQPTMFMVLVATSCGFGAVRLPAASFKVRRRATEIR